MPFSLQQIPSESKFTQVFRVEVLDQLYPREEVADLLTRCHGWEERERKLSQIVIVYYVMGLSLVRRLNLAAVFRWSSSWTALALARRRPGLAHGWGIEKPSQTIGRHGPASALWPQMSAHGHPRDPRRLPLRAAAHGDRWHAG